MDKNKTTLSIIGVIVVVALVITACVCLLDKDKDASDDLDETLTVTFEKYSDSTHPTTTIAFKLNGKDVTGTTQVIENNTVVIIEATSSEDIYGIIANILPNSGNAVYRSSHDDSAFDSDGFYNLEVTLDSFLGTTLKVSAKPYYAAADGDWPSADTYTTISIQEGLVCTMDGKELSDGEVIKMSGSNTMVISIVLPYKATLICSGNWDDGSTYMGGFQNVTEEEIKVFCSATFNDLHGTLNITYRT